MIRLDNAANDLHIPILHNGWRNTYCNLYKYILQFGEIHFVTLKNTVIRLDNGASDLHILRLHKIWRNNDFRFIQIHFTI